MPRNCSLVTSRSSSMPIADSGTPASRRRECGASAGSGRPAVAVAAGRIHVAGSEEPDLIAVAQYAGAHLASLATVPIPYMAQTQPASAESSPAQHSSSGVSASSSRSAGANGRRPPGSHVPAHPGSTAPRRPPRGLPVPVCACRSQVPAAASFLPRQGARSRRAVPDPLQAIRAGWGETRICRQCDVQNRGLGSQ